MLLAVLILVGFCFFLLERVWKMKKKITDVEKVLKLINSDLNMVSKTMENMHKHEKAKELSKQILKG
jgi:uncharacterized protein YoxC